MNKEGGFSMKKSKFLAVCLIGVLMAAALVMMGCDGSGCIRELADCRSENACGNSSCAPNANPANIQARCDC
jgi:hypothetical protein